MKSFISTLTAALNGDFGHDIEPTEPVEPGESVIGVLKEPVAISLFGLRNILVSRFSDKIKNFQKKVDEEFKKCVEENKDVDHNTMISIFKAKIPGFEKAFNDLDIQDLLEQSDTCNKIFWIRFYEIYPDLKVDGLGVAIKAGWKIVTFKSTQVKSGLVFV